MCEPSLILGTVISLAGSAIQGANNSKAEKRRLRAIESAQEEQLGFDKKRLDTVEENAEVFAPEAVQERLDTHGERLGDTFTRSILDSRDAGEAGLNTIDVGASDAFLKERGKRATSRLKKSIGMAQLAGKLSAPGFAAFDANKADQDFVTRQNKIGLQSTGALNTANSRISRIRPDQGVNAAGAFLSGIGGAVSNSNKLGSLFASNASPIKAETSSPFVGSLIKSGFIK